MPLGPEVRQTVVSTEQPDVIDLTDRPIIDHLSHEAERREVAEVESHGEVSTRGDGRRGHRATAGRGVRHRLLDEDMQAEGERAQRRLVVMLHRRGDDHRVHLVREERIEGRGRRRPTGGRLGRARGGVEHRREGRPGMGLHGRDP